MRKYYPSNDLEVVLMFFPELEGDIVLAIEWMEYLPLVKRGIYRVLGVPDSDQRTVLKYGDKRIHIVSLRGKKT